MNESVNSGHNSVIDLPKEGTVIAFDFGLKRIGVATGELSLKVAHPLLVINNQNNVINFTAITKLINEWQPKILVVGIPFFMDGREHEVTKLCKAFAAKLESRFKIQTIMADERLTSAAASQALNEIGIQGYRQKQKLDQVAAQQILQTFFEDLKNVT